MISFISVIGLTTFINCSDVVFLNEHPANSVYYDHPVAREKQHCKIQIQKHNRAYSALTFGSCDKVIKLCNIKVQR